MSDKAPAYRVPVLHFDALRLVALREARGDVAPPKKRVFYDRVLK